MNASGECVEKFAKFYKIEAKDIITIFDDIDIETGTMKIRKKRWSRDTQWNEIYGKRVKYYRFSTC